MAGVRRLFGDSDSDSADDYLSDENEEEFTPYSGVKGYQYEPKRTSTVGLGSVNDSENGASRPPRPPSQLPERVGKTDWFVNI